MQEFQLGISNYDLSTGASSTGSVNIISSPVQTSSTATDTSMPAVTSGRRFRHLARLDAANGIPVAARRRINVPFDRQQYGGTLGWSNQARQTVFLHRTTKATIRTAPLCTIRSKHRRFAGFTASPFNEKLFTTKVDWVVGSNTTVNTRYSFNDNVQDVPFPPGSGIVPRDSASGHLSNQTTSWSQTVLTRSSPALLTTF